MQIKSNRQFRTYVISWFLVVAGLIVSLGGVSIYYSAENHLLENYQRDKLAQITTMATLIDAEQHLQIQTPKIAASSNNNKLYKVFEKAAASDGFHHRLFSLNFSPSSEQLKYAIAPTKLATDSIMISSDIVEMMITVNPDGKPQLIYRGNPVKRIDITRKNQNYLIQLNSNTKSYSISINDKDIVQLNLKPELTAKYKNIELDAKQLKTQVTMINFFENEFLFKYRFIPAAQKIHIAGTSFYDDEALTKSLLLVVKSATPSAGIYQSRENGLADFYVYAPIIKQRLQGQEKSYPSLLVLHINRQTLSQLRENLRHSILLELSLLAIMLMGAAIFFARKITNPLEQLTLAIARLMQNDFNFKLSTKKFGSFGYLANLFNLMLARLQKSRGELIQLNKSYSRFVPHQLLKQLSSAGVNDIALGDSCERQMTVLFCDIRGFTTLSETMSPGANFRFINRYLKQIAPVINKRGGIIDKYLGDGIMALFPNGADEALNAAIEMLESLDEYNQVLQQKNLPAIEVGLGLHAGRTMLGTVGTPSRMDATVISDTVNAAARVESMTKSFCTKILITEETKRQLKKISDYRIRYIASCRIQGKSKPVTLYEVYNNDPYSLQQEKSQNQNMMIQAWKKYKQGDSAMAIQMYQKLIEKSPNDKSLFALIERCQSGRL
ncbi:adenylate/guanylate cyclase domain-containing protein [Aliikangiella coralliicola]|uniref:Adenylate/guanylate cyclase domain-containing protein n=1 Tax=Aliikangiella coralliicola TaxID=2592383 RepID=A0A545UIC3_9GAMM|nr:adenylate/guanylate cyclase domain-containing protein [Aliikangiella coralliicola]TQV89183.1 hypothetical protein FLL46_03370 [Aliikangiella coralliicola]